MKRLSMVLGALLLSVTPVFADVAPDQFVVFKKSCMGTEKMEDDYKIQKAKYCDCMADLIYVKYAGQDFKEIFQEIVTICKNKYPPIN